MSTNIVLLSGNLGNDVELKTFDNNSVIGNFSLATNYSYTSKDGQTVDQTDWHNIVVRGKLAENCSKYISKGSKVLVQGSLRNRKYKNKEDITIYVTEVIANSVEFLDNKSS